MEKKIFTLLLFVSIVVCNVFASEGYYKVQPVNDSKVLTASGNSLVFNAFTNTNPQTWQFVKSGNYFKIMSEAKYLTAGTTITAVAANNADSQLWTVNRLADGTYRIISKTNGLALELSGSLKLVAVAENNAQKWKLFYTKLYLVGGATPGKWDIGKMQVMNLVSGKDGVFTWTGTLLPSDFKFQLTQSSTWLPTVNAPKALEYVQLGTTHQLITNAEYKNDYKFRLSRGGYYTITADMAKGTMTVTENIPSLYITGPAANAWDLTKVTKMNAVAGQEGVFTWEGNLNADFLKFLILPNTWNNSVNALAYNQPLIPNIDLPITITDGNERDFKFRIPKTGYYVLTVNTKNKTVKMTEKAAPITALYVIGDATTAGWDNTKGIAMTKVNNNVDTWTGNLQADKHFKFITQVGTWNSIVPSIPSNEFVVNEYLHKISDIYVGDYRFIAPETGQYKVTVDLAAKTMIVSKTPVASQVYLIGDATSIGWDNTKALAMTRTAEGIFTWTGDLQGGRHFKFITKLGTWNSLVPNKYGNETITSGFAHQISNYYKGDYRFVIADAGQYKVTINLKNHTVTLDKVSGNPLYILGDATTVGWDNTKAAAMTESPTGVFTWTGNLQAGKHFKFITKLGTWNSIIPATYGNETIINGYAHNISNVYVGDYRFVSPETSQYKITVDMTNKTLVAKKLPANTPIYLIGDATSAGWNNAAALPMSEVSEGVYTWTGSLEASKHFKFISKLGTWQSIVPNKHANEAISIGKAHSVTNYYSGDYRFVTPKAGIFRINLDLKNRTLTVIENVPTKGAIDNSELAENFTILPTYGTVEVKINNGAKVKRAELVSLTGARIALSENKSDSFFLGSGVPAGVYIVKLQTEGDNIAQKVIIK